jgi:hypothetical protein
MMVLSATFDFGPVSTRDATVFTAKRPGNSLPAGDSSSIRLTLEDVQPWLDYMVAQGITIVIALLDENERSIYADPGLIGFYQTATIQGHVVSMSQPDAPTKILDIVQQTSDAGGSLYWRSWSSRTCCRGMVHYYHLSPEDATAETMAQANESGVKRKGDVESLKKWMGTCFCNNKEKNNQFSCYSE